MINPKALRASISAQADQATNAGTILVIHVWMARALPVDDYGRFASLHALLVLCNMLHNAFVAEPLNVFRADFEPGALGQFDRAIARINRQFATVWLGLCVVVASASAMAGALYWSGSFLAVGVTGVGLSHAWLARRLCYARREPGRALILSLLFAAVTLVLLAAFAGIGRIDYRLTILVMGVGGLLFALGHRGVKQPPDSGESRESRRGVLNRSVRYGLWSAGASGLNWLGSYAVYIVLPIVGGFLETAVFRAAMNLYAPFQHVLLGLTTLLLAPMATSVRASQSKESLRAVGQVIAMMILLALVYGTSILLAADQLVTILYAGKFALAEAVVRLGSPIPVAWAILAACVMFLRALGKPRLVFFAYAIALLIVGAWVLVSDAGANAERGIVVYAVLQGITALCLVAAVVGELRKAMRLERGLMATKEGRHEESL